MTNTRGTTRQQTVRGATVASAAPKNRAAAQAPATSQMLVNDGGNADRHKHKHKHKHKRYRLENRKPSQNLVYLDD